MKVFLTAYKKYTFSRNNSKFFPSNLCLTRSSRATNVASDSRKYKKKKLANSREILEYKFTPDINFGHSLVFMDKNTSFLWLAPIIYKQFRIIHSEARFSDCINCILKCFENQSFQMKRFKEMFKSTILFSPLYPELKMNIKPFNNQTQI